jgi:hypothetical protein
MAHPNRLTLRFDFALIEGAKAFAQEHERSVSQRSVSQRSVSLPSGNRALEPRPITRSIVEALKAKHTTKNQSWQTTGGCQPNFAAFLAN